MKKIILIFSAIIICLTASAQALRSGSKRLKDGAIYTGPLLRDKPEGKGKAEYPDHSTYEGDFTKGLRNGYGTFTKPNGERLIRQRI